MLSYLPEEAKILLTCYNDTTGGVCLYRKQQGQWLNCTLILIPDLKQYTSTQFGKGVSFTADGSLLAVGAPMTDNGGQWKED